MTTTLSLKDILHTPALARKDRILLCMSEPPIKARSVSEIKQVAIAAGLRNVNSWNLSQILSGMESLAIRVPDGWELTSAGIVRAHQLRNGARVCSSAPVSKLRDLLPKIKSKDARDFLTEAIACFEAEYYRAAVVLSWVGAVSVLYARVVAGNLAAFNAEASRRDAKWRTAKNADDLGRLREHDFLQILEAISIIGKNVKSELEICLKLRNACGHPNSLKVAGYRAAAHLEILILNVFSVFI